MKAIGTNVMSVRGLDDARNARTRIARGVVAPRRDLGTLFAGAYTTFASTCRAAAKPGLAIVAIDEQWSAVRMRPGTPAEQRKAASLAAAMRAPKSKTKPKPATKTPRDLDAAITASAAAKQTFGSLAPSHHREYVTWVEDAKKPETRARRVADAVKMLEAGVRDRNARYR